MVGDAEDQKRWQKVREYGEAGRRLEEKTISKDTPQWKRAELLEQSRAMHRYAHSLTV